jgi:pantoate--beta-alanine ligase
LKTYKHIGEFRAALSELRRAGNAIGFVPTMGFLHEGHLTLVRQAIRDNPVTVVSIFVNPIQFAPNEDYETYPRDFDRDAAFLEKEGVDYLFYPSAEEIYPDGFSTTVNVSGLTDGLCGAKRRGHFEGVATVVTKLLLIVSPDNIYMGMKDYQQLKVVSKMVKDLNIPCKVNGVEIVREDDGLAMSSRNFFLRKEERDSALSLYNSLSLVRKLINEGVTSSEKAKVDVINYIHSYKNTRIDYVEFVDPDRLKPVENLNVSFVCMLAVYVGGVRLIDNMVFYR